MRPRTVRQICVLLLVFASSAPQAGVTPINVGNLVWNDVDADGIQDANEPGLGSVTVQLWNEARSQLLDSAVTSAAGIYALQAPGPGNYRVRVVLPMAGDGFSPKDAAPTDQTDSDINPSGTLLGFTDTYVFASNLISITTIDAGIVRAPIALGDRVWNDYDADGVQDAGEPGIAGTTVELWNDTRTLNLLSTTTDATGGYQLQAPGPGSYRIRVAKASQDSYAPKDAGASDLLDSDVNPSGTDIGYTDVLAVSAASTAIDGGIVRLPINVGNFVWNDADRDGVQDAGEPGIPAVVVQLWNSTRNQLLDSATTNASGIYLLQAPGPGDYRVRVVLPTVQDAFSPKDSPPSDLTDSDINPTGATLGFTDVYTFAPNLISITTVDGGLLANTLFANGFE
ncbi:MAG: hypothetical protein KA911_09460 [Xanthomonadales bacterium]|nr:hypothetical protein [Xanthomonadales bacterium]